MNKSTLQTLWDDFNAGQTYKSSIGKKGIYEQARINERFFVGDQWHGLNAGNDRPLTRRNIIKRIGEFKIAAIGAAPIAVNYSADGVPDTTDLKEDKNRLKETLIAGDPTVKPTAPKYRW